MAAAAPRVVDQSSFPSEGALRAYLARRGAKQTNRPGYYALRDGRVARVERTGPGYYVQLYATRSACGC